MKLFSTPSSYISVSQFYLLSICLLFVFVNFSVSSLFSFLRKRQLPILIRVKRTQHRSYMSALILNCNKTLKLLWGLSVSIQVSNVRNLEPSTIFVGADTLHNTNHHSLNFVGRAALWTNVYVIGLHTFYSWLWLHTVREETCRVKADNLILNLNHSWL